MYSGSSFNLFFISSALSILKKSISKAEEIEAFCLINYLDLKNANLAKEDHHRFAGKEIHFLINCKKNK